MKLVVGSDHAAFDAKHVVVDTLKKLGHETEDLGTLVNERCDYPDFAKAVCEAVLAGKADHGILLCGTGIGMSITANRFKGIRAALCHDVNTAKICREHNNANVLVLGARVLALDTIKAMIEAYLTTDFEGGRHQGRLDKADAVC